MKRRILLTVLLAAETYGAGLTHKAPQVLAFQPNVGQFKPEVEFGSTAGGVAVEVTRAEVRFLSLGAQDIETLHLRWKHGRAGARPTPVDPLPGRVNYLIGSDPAHWHTEVPSYGKIRIQNVCSGADLVLYGNERLLEYDLVLSAGADIRSCELSFDGARSLRRTQAGDLIAELGSVSVRQHRPEIYQETEGHRTQVQGDFVLKSSNAVGFELGPYDHRRPVVIDPALSFSTLFGGSGIDRAQAVAVDASGNIYVAGDTTSLDFPVTNAYEATPPGQTSYANPRHIFVTKLDPTGSTVLFSTYLGGSTGESGRAIAVDASGNVFITGSTVSSDYPITAGTLRGPTNAAGKDDIVLTKLSASGSSLLYSAIIGGSNDDEVSGLAIDGSGNAFLAGTTSSVDFPVTVGARNDLPLLDGINSTAKAFVSKINPGGTAFVYSAVLGGTGVDQGTALAIDGSGVVYAAGTTTSTDFPVTNGAYQTNSHLSLGNTKGWVAKLCSNGSALLFATYLGGSGSESISGLAFDNFGKIYVTGLTTSPDFPVSPQAFNSPASGGANAVFVSKLSGDGASLLYSSIFGGNNNAAAGIAVDANGSAIVAGSTDFRFPVKAGAPQINSGANGPGGTNAFVIKLNAQGTDTLYSTYLGGQTARAAAVAVDSYGMAIVAGLADSSFPVTAGSYRSFYSGQVFVAKMSESSSCNYTTTSSSSWSVSVAAPAGCKWIAVSNVPWLRVTSGASGSGNGSVQFAAQTNMGAARSGVASVAGNLFTFTQASGCQYTLSSPGRDVPSTSTADQFTLFAPGGCSFPTAVPSASWIHITSAPSASPFTYTVEANTADQTRSGTITVGSAIFTVTQSAAPCAVAACGIYDDRDPKVIYSGSWFQNGAPGGPYNNTQSFTYTPGASATFTFSGTQVTFLYATNPNFGCAKVTIDGTVVSAALDAYSPALVWQKTQTYSGLSAGSHTLTLTLLSQKNTLSSGTYFTVDAFAVGPVGQGTYDDRDPRLLFAGNWGKNSGSSTGGPTFNTQSFSNTAGDSVSFTFSGTQITYVYATAPNLGMAQVSIDGRIVSAQIDAYSPTLSWQQAVTYSNLGAGPHTIVITVLGSKNPQSSSAYITVDAFVVGLPTDGSYDDGTSLLVYSGVWNKNAGDGRGGPLNSTQTFSNRAGDSVSFTFFGNQITYLYTAAPNLGIAQVSIDGIIQGQIDEYAPSILWRQAITFSGLQNGVHTITVAVTGQKNSAASAIYVTIDAFVVGPPAPGYYDDTDARMLFFGSGWTRYNGGSAAGQFNGTQTYSLNPGDFALFTFTGSQVTFVYPLSPGLGCAEVSIDGVVVAPSLDQYGPVTTWQQSTTYQTTPGTHTMKIKVLGTRNPGASSAYVVVDAIFVAR